MVQSQKLNKDLGHFSYDKTHCTLSSKSPTTSNMSYHTTTPEILDTHILSFMLVPKETHANTSRPFLNIISTTKVQSSGFFQFSSSNQVLFLYNYNTSNPNPTHTFQYFKKSNNLAFLQHQKTCLHFLNLHQIFSSSPHLLASLKSSYQFPHRNLIHKAHEEFSLSSWNCVPFRKLTH